MTTPMTGAITNQGMIAATFWRPGYRCGLLLAGSVMAWSCTAVASELAPFRTTNAVSPTVGPAPRTEWVRAGVTDQKSVWGVKGRLLWGLPDGRSPRDGPRGLIRLWFPVLTNGGYDLINFIAVEPVVRGRKGFSELEHSQLDGVQGKRLWCEPEGPPAQSATKFAPGHIGSLASGAESLRVEAGVERFDNGAHVGLVITQRSDAPDEIEFAIHAQADSAPIEYCILTATMGNKARARLLWLKDGPVSSLKLYPDYIPIFKILTLIPLPIKSFTKSLPCDKLLAILSSLVTIIVSPACSFDKSFVSSGLSVFVPVKLSWNISIAPLSFNWFSCPSKLLPSFACPFVDTLE